MCQRVASRIILISTASSTLAVISDTLSSRALMRSIYYYSFLRMGQSVQTNCPTLVSATGRFHPFPKTSISRRLGTSSDMRTMSPTTVRTLPARPGDRSSQSALRLSVKLALALFAELLDHLLCFIGEFVAVSVANDAHVNTPWSLADH